MSQIKGISVSLDVDLHGRIKTEQEAMRITMRQYIIMVLNEHFKKEEGKKICERTRMLALQANEELKQKEFFISLIEQALDVAEAALAAEEARVDSGTAE